MKVQKRDGRIAVYDADKIRAAIEKANAAVEAAERVDKQLIEDTIRYVEEHAGEVMPVESIQDLIEEQLVGHNKYTLAKKYMIHRYQRARCASPTPPTNPF